MDERRWTRISVMVGFNGLLVLLALASCASSPPQITPIGSASGAPSESRLDLGPLVVADASAPALATTGYNRNGATTSLPPIRRPAPDTSMIPPVIPSAPVVASHVPAAELTPPPSLRVPEVQPLTNAMQDEPPVALADAFEEAFDPLHDFANFAATDIATINFRDGFTYLVQGEGQVTVANSGGETDGAGYSQVPLSLAIGEIVYGDISGDGVDEAAIAINLTWRDGVRSHVEVFSVIDGQLELMGRTWSDQGAQSTRSSVRIDSGILVIESLRSSTGGECCADEVARSEWAAGTSPWSLRVVAEYLPRSYRNLSDLYEPATGELVFHPGTISAVLDARNDVTSVPVRFAAEGGMVMRLSEHEGSGARLRVRHEATGGLVGDLTADADLQLAHDGRYTATMLFDDPTSVFARVEVTIADQRTLTAPTWTTRVSRSITEEPQREISLQLPEFASAHQNVDVGAINEVIATVISDRITSHNAEVDLTCADDEPSIYDLSFRPTLISYDLVSIEFDEFVCLCENGDAFNRFTLIIDLNTAEVLTANDIIEDHAGLRLLWWQTAQSQQSWAFNGAAETPPASLQLATSITPYGLLLTAEAGQVDGFPNDVVAEISFEELGVLVSQQIVTRAESGAAVSLPYQETCGC